MYMFVCMCVRVYVLYVYRSMHVRECLCGFVCEAFDNNRNSQLHSLTD